MALWLSKAASSLTTMTVNHYIMRQTIKRSVIYCIKTSLFRDRIQFVYLTISTGMVELIALYHTPFLTNFEWAPRFSHGVRHWKGGFHRRLSFCLRRLFTSGALFDSGVCWQFCIPLRYGLYLKAAFWPSKPRILQIQLCQLKNITDNCFHRREI